MNLIDVTYDERVSAPEAVAERILEVAGLPVSADVPGLRDHMREHPRMRQAPVASAITLARSPGL